MAIDTNGVKHFVWSQQTATGTTDIFYSRVFPVDPSSENGELTQSIPVNVSNSSSFSSSVPQIVVDSVGRAHIVWQEENNDHVDDYSLLDSRIRGFYSRTVCQTHDICHFRI